MGDDDREPDVAALAELCSRNEPRFDPADAAEVVRLALSVGATPEEIAEAADVGVVVLDHRLRTPGSSTAGDVVAALGVEWDTTEPYLRAAGLSVDPEERLTEGEVEATRLFLGARQLLGEEGTLQLARMTGNVTARLAESAVDLFRLRIEMPRRDAGSRPVDTVEETSGLAQGLLPEFSRTIDALLRRRVLSVAATMWSIDDERTAITVARTVGFVDLVGYTETTSSMTVGELASVLLEFDRVTSDVVSRHGGSVIKSIGDEILFSTEDASEACRIAVELLQASGSALPEVRIGLARGEMVTVFGDLFGPDVNLAARLVGAADPSSAVASDRVRDAAPGFTFEPLAPLSLKGVAEPVVAYRLLA